jgi:hypothetical protein
VPLDGKQDIATRLLQEECIDPEQAAVVGDSVFDIPQTNHVGLTIAYNAHDPEVEAKQTWPSELRPQANPAMAYQWVTCQSVHNSHHWRKEADQSPRH